MTRLIDADVLIHKLKTAIELGQKVDESVTELHAVLGDVESMPTIDAEPQWIPVSERPVIDGQYIVSLIDDNGLFTDIAEWNSTLGGRWQALFVDDDHAELCDINNVVAWMPLPKPYEVEHDTAD